MRNKILSLILTLCMILSVCQFPLMVSADTGDATTPARTVTMEITKFPSGTTTIPCTVTTDDPKWWLAVYPASQTAYGGSNGVYCDYLSDATGERAFPSGQAIRMKKWPLPDGAWKLVLFNNDSYTDIADEQKFVVGLGNLSPAKPSFEVGEDIVFNYSDSDSAKDFVSIYALEDEDGTTSASGELAWAYAAAESGSLTQADFSKTAWATTPGKYVAKFWQNNNYNVEMHRVYFEIVPAKRTEYYVSASGNDSTGYGSEEAPLATVAKAIELLGADKDGKIIVMGAAYPFEGAAHTGLITYEAYDENASLGGTLTLKGPSVIKVPISGKINLSTGHYIEFDAPMGIGSNCIDTMTLNGTSGSQKVVVKDGFINALRSNTSDNVDVLIDGGIVRLMSTYAVTKNLNIVVKSGQYWVNNHIDDGPVTVDGAFQLILNAGTNTVPDSTFGGGKYVDWAGSKITFSDGEYTIKSADTENFLDTTDTVGKYAVTGDKIAYWQTSDKKTVYYSKNGYITLPAQGTYDILWTDAVENIALPDGMNKWVEETDGVLTAKLVIDSIHVSTTGDDSTGNGSNIAPFATIAKAIEHVGTDKNGTITIMDNMAFADVAHTGTITYVPYSGTAGSFTSDVSIHGPSIIKVPISVTGLKVTTNGHYLLNEAPVNTSIYSYFIAGNAEGKDEVVYLNGGNTWQNAYTRLPGQPSGDVKYVIDGAVVRMIAPGIKADVSSSVHIGNIDAVVYSGELWYLNKGDIPDGTVSDGAIQVVFNNNTYSKFKNDYLTTAKVKFNGGKWLIKSSDTNGNLLDTTDTVGKFAVTGSKTAYWQTSDKKTVYYSKNGYLTLPSAAIYNILWTDNVNSIALPAGAVAWEDNGAGVMTAKYIATDAYVSASGNDSTGDGTASAPYATIAKAISTCGADKDITICIMGTYTFADVAHTGKITYYPYDTNAKLAGGNINVSGPSVINVNTGSAAHFYANGHYLEIGGAITSVKNKVTMGSLAATPVTVVLKGQYFEDAYAQYPGQQGGDAHLIIDGAKVYNCRPGPGSAGSVPSVFGNFRVTVNSGELLFSNTIGTVDTTYKKDSDAFLAFAFNQGTYDGITPHTFGGAERTTFLNYVTGNANFKGGEAMWISTEKDNFISPTSVHGVYEVTGTKTAYYQTSDKKTVYYSKNGKITLPDLVLTNAKVLWTDDFSTNILAKPGAQNGVDFVQWIDDGKGTITASYKKTPTQFEYYLKSGGTGDGKTLETAAGNVAKVIATINADGHDETTEVTVWLVDSGEKREIGEKVNKTDIANYMYYGVAADHSTKITFSTYNYNAQNNNRAVLYMYNAFVPVGNTNTTLLARGDVRFENLIIIDCRTDYYTDINAQGHDMEFKNTSLRRIKLSATSDLTGDGKVNNDDHKYIVNNTDTPATIVKKNESPLFTGPNRSGTGSVGEGGTVIVNNPGEIFKYITFGTYSDTNNHAATTMTFENSNTLIVSGDISEIQPAHTSSDTYVTVYKKNLNLFVDGATVGKFGGGTKNVVEGAIQVILTNGAKLNEFSAADKSSKDSSSAVGTADYFVMDNVTADGQIEFTEVPGKFKVTSGKKYAYAYSNDADIAYYGEDFLVVAKSGKYVVKYADSVAEIMAALPALEDNAETGEIFKGWTDNGNGTVTPTFGPKEAVTKEYYVMFGGTGDGRSASAPAASVNNVIASVNADGLIKGDIAKVYIMECEDFIDEETGKFGDEGKTSSKSTLVQGLFTYWKVGGGAIPAHNATLLVTSYDYEEGNPAKPKKHLAFSDKIGENSAMSLAGPTIFEDINIVRPRNVDREIRTNGNYVEFNNTNIYQAKADFWSSTPFTGIEELHANVIAGGDSSTVKGSELHFNSPLAASRKNNHGIGIRAYGRAVTFTEPVTFYLNNTGINSQFNWGNPNTEYTTTLEKGFNIVVNAVGSIIYPTSATYLPAAAVTITGGLQIINNNGYTFPAVPSNVKADATWIVNSANNAGGTLDKTDVAGTFAVLGGKVAYAQSADKKTIYYGAETLTLPAGTWTISYAADIDAVKTSAERPADIDEYNLFNSWTDNGDGTMTAKYVYTIPTYYVAATGGSDSNDGLTPATAFATTTKAIDAIEANGKNGVVNVIGAVTLTLKAHENRIYWESYNGGTIAGTSNKISLAGPTVLNADFAAGQSIYTNGYYLELGGAVNESQNNYIYAGNTNNTTGADENIVLRGKFVYKMTTHVTGQKTGNVDIFIDGGVLRQLSSGTGVVDDGTYNVDSIRVTIKSGEFWCFNHSDDDDGHKAQGAFEFIANAGEYYFPEGNKLLSSITVYEWADYTPNGANGFVKIQWEDGKYIIRSADPENFIYGTDTPGKYTYEGTKTPYYVSENGLNVYYGKDGKFNIPDGTIDVLWADEFKAENMPEPNLSTGYEFGGWTDDGNGLLTAIVINPNFYYVDGVNGDDSSNGTEETPYKTIAKAITSLKGKNGTVYVIGSAEYADVAAHDGYVTIVGTASGASLEILDTINGNTVLKNITLPESCNIINLGDFGRFEIAENVIVESELVQINAGETQRVILGDGNYEINYTSTSAELVLNGSTAKIKGTVGNATVYAYGATVTANRADVTIDESLVIVANDSVIKTDIVNDKFTVINSNNAANEHVAASTTSGAYSVKAPYGTTPLAIGADGKVYVADEFTTEDIAPNTWYDRNEYTEYTKYRKPLNNTYKKLTEDKELKVAYFGGSVTNGSGNSWRLLTSKWFVDNFPEANVTNVNRACGESGTYLGTYRLQEDVIAIKPDLLFLEYSINDKYYGSTYAEAASQYETIVREVKQALPETDIITILVSDTGTLSANKQGKLHTQAQAHEDMAIIYDIPSLHVGRRLAEVCNYDANVFKPVYAKDIVHLTDAGNYVYYQVIEEYLHNSLFCTDFSTLPERNDELPVTQNKLFDGNRTHYECTPELLAESERLGGSGVARTGGNAYSNVTEAEGNYVFNSTSDEFIFKFNGTDVALWSNYYKSNFFLISIDGGEYKEVEGSSHAPARIIEGLPSGDHTVGIKIKDATTNLKIYSIYTRDITKVTPAGTAHTYKDYTNATFNVPAGNYNVEYLSDVATVADIPFKGAQDMIFMGWADAEGNAVTFDTAVVPGMVLVPVYEDVDDYINFAGVQIRVASADKRQGLRFVADIKKSLDEKTELEEFGMVLIPSAMIGDNRAYTEYNPEGGNCEYNIIGAEQIYNGSTHTYGGKIYNSATVKAEHIFKDLGDALRYTTCVIGITEANYTRYYTIRAYAKYNVNGKSYTAYSDAFRSSIYEVAKAASVDDTITEEAKAVVDGIISKVEG